MRTSALLLIASTSIASLTAPGAAQTTPAPLVITANPYAGLPVSPYDQRVSPYSVNGARNPYTTGGGRVVGADGQYLGKLNANKYDPESVSNPYGQYGSKYSPTSINNPYSTYGSPHSPLSVRNPYAATPPRVVYPSAAGVAPNPQVSMSRVVFPVTAPRVAYLATVTPAPAPSPYTYAPSLP